MIEKDKKILNKWIESNEALLIILAFCVSLFILFSMMGANERYIESSTVTESITGTIIRLNTTYDSGNAGGEISGTGRHYYAYVKGNNNIEYEVAINIEEYEAFNEGDTITFIRTYYIDKKGNEIERICKTVNVK